MVSGRSAALTALAPHVSQWALTISTALGRGSSAPSWAQARLQALSSMAFIGEPWPRNRTGRRAVMGQGVRLDTVEVTDRVFPLIFNISARYPGPCGRDDD